MPYIAKVDRPKYELLISTVMDSIYQKGAAPMVQAEGLGYFIEALIQSLRKISNPQLKFEFHFFVGSGSEAKFREYAAALARILPVQIESRAGELNYVLSTISWGLTGDAPDIPSARYCGRSFIKGALWRALLSNLNSFDGAEYIFYTGVITDVIDEIYRRRTAVYEDQKIQEQGDLWE
jgi:hypothetical protein